MTSSDKKLIITEAEAKASAEPLVTITQPLQIDDNQIMRLSRSYLEQNTKRMQELNATSQIEIGNY